MILMFLRLLLLVAGTAALAQLEVTNKIRSNEMQRDIWREGLDNHRASLEGVVPLHKLDLVQYKNHPMQAWAYHHRHLIEKHDGNLARAHADVHTGTHTKNHNLNPPRRLEEDDSSWQPMRITFHTATLEEQHDNGENTRKIKFIIDQILPAVADYWSSALQVIPIAGNLTVDKFDLLEGGKCGHPAFSVVPDSHTTEGVENSDLMLYVSASKEFCSAGTLAFATSCSYDAFDRPIAGAVNVCLDEIDFHLHGWTSERIFQHSLSIAIHEIAHVLIMSSSHFRFFRYPDGEPRTPRPIAIQEVTCPNGVNRSVPLPSENTLQILEDASRGERYATVVTEGVRSVARNQFDCQSLPGARLENLPTSATCLGGHWDEREWYSSTMSAIVDDTGTFLTPLTLALAEDSSWYKSNFSMAHISPWGHAAGCDFVNQPCRLLQETKNSDGSISKNSLVPDYGRGFFCAERRHKGCNPGHTHKLMCYDGPEQMGTNPTCLVNSAPYETESEWLAYVTGLDLDGPDCRKESTDDLLNAYFEYFGKGSMCFEAGTEDGPIGLCYQAHCVVEERVLKLNFRNEWYTCERDFQEIPITTFSYFEATITCPRLASACPEMFCPANCAGRGVCDYDHVISADGTGNATGAPKCICDDPTDTSPGCYGFEGVSLDENEEEKDKYVATSEDLPKFRANDRIFGSSSGTWRWSGAWWLAGWMLSFVLCYLC